MRFELKRSFVAELPELRENVLSTRVVPWDVATPVADLLRDGTLDRYVEGFRRGAFDRQVNTKEPGVIRNIELKHRHDGGLGTVGQARSMRNEDDGLWLDFKVFHSRAQDVAEIIGEGVDGLSMEFVTWSNGTSIDDDGVRWRTSAHLDAVAFEPVQAYKGALVMGFRDGDEELGGDVDDRAAEAAATEAKAQQRAELQAWLAEQDEKNARYRALAGS